MTEWSGLWIQQGHPLAVVLKDALTQLNLPVETGACENRDAHNSLIESQIYWDLSHLNGR